MNGAYLSCIKLKRVDFCRRDQCEGGAGQRSDDSAQNDHHGQGPGLPLQQELHPGYGECPGRERPPPTVRFGCDGGHCV